MEIINLVTTYLTCLMVYGLRQWSGFISMGQQCQFYCSKTIFEDLKFWVSESQTLVLYINAKHLIKRLIWKSANSQISIFLFCDFVTYGFYSKEAFLKDYGLIRPSFMTTVIWLRLLIILIIYIYIYIYYIYRYDYIHIYIYTYIYD